ncbi:MAG: UDP-N-acetylmuramoyl-L-alanine--D-glutamate ligase [Candidatus Saccharibacteria bacterium]|nr:UDP-N-acetylmuramoyl-L-alanine--D-glutamate ligase [Candidatus Saccharibacteria bacterium]
MKQQIIDFLRDKSILILGFGREGRSTLKFIRENLPEANIAIADQNPITDEDDVKNTTIISGENYLAACKNYDLILKAPGVIIKDLLDAETKAKITSQTDLFMRAFHRQVIGITGTKGKSTTSSLIYHVLKTANFDTFLVGNIGKPCFDIIDEINEKTVIVYELSAHQLEYIQASPYISVLLNIYEEHFDHYTTPEDYYGAKKNIFKYQTADDLLIYGDIFQHATQEELAAAPVMKIDITKTEIFPRDQIRTKLIGEHNQLNIQVAAAIAYAFKINGEIFKQAIASFQPLPHRLEYVGTFRDIKFYNDSIATAQEAVMNAIKALGDVDTIILGGMDRGLDYHPLVDFIRQTNIRNVILLPATDARFKAIFDEGEYSQNLIPVKDMHEAVEQAYKLTTPNKSCLLSPAAASYGFYKNFEERGDDFKKLVNKL